MSGLGILVEENHYDDILPPLPTDHDDLKQDLQEIVLQSPLQEKFDNSNNSDYESELYDLNNNTEKNDYINYELDSPNLMKSNYFDNSSNNSSNSEPQEKLSKLKSLKKSIRKISLSSHTSPLINTPKPSKSINITPMLSRNSSSSTSLNDKFNNSPERKIDTTKNWDKKSIDEFKISLSQKHSPSNSISSTNTNTQKSILLRNRAVSLTTSSTASTPPLNSPIITISENLSLPKKSINNIEQNYFDKFSNNQINNLTDLENSQDLINYSQYLIYQKNHLIDAFNLAEKKLSDSGWCSNHDLNNLHLQQDSSISQIDTKLLQIEEKLNREHNLSLLGNKMEKKSEFVDKYNDLSIY